MLKYCSLRQPPSDQKRVLAVTREQGDTSDWAGLGKGLTRLLVPTGEYIGVCFDGQLPLELLRGVFDSTGAFQAEVRVMSREHPVLLGRWSSNLTWMSYHHVHEKAWIDSLWTRIDRRWLHVGSDLFLASYSMDVISKIQWEEASTVDPFGRTLALSSGWVLPLSDDPDVLIGVTRQSSAFAAVRALATG